jgi:hypothetical protein
MTIPSTPSEILITQDWTKKYQSYPNAEFQSYDFVTLRRIMIAYLQENFPEDFNDYTDSSEYIALVDLIAYLGQNLSFRIDLNARENFLETAQRRDSILRLAQLVSYNPARNTPASGVLKITAISTTESVFDNTGVNLANTTVVWNDPRNPNWYEQFISIINATMNPNFGFNNPYDSVTINGILTQKYQINSSNKDVPIFDFTKNISGTSMNFEIVPASLSNGVSITEQPPQPSSNFSFLYQNDYQGNSSANTGFFTYFRQGQIGLSNFAVTNPSANEIIGVNINGINNSDVWLWQTDSDGNYKTLWSRVPAITGNSVIYNSINSNTRNIYSVSTRDQDQIDLNFSDGSFGNLPQGNFALFYRQSNGLTYSITPQQMSGITIQIPYVNQNGQNNSITMTMGLQYTVSNSSGPETNDSIKLKAPQTYYTQNRMVTAEDYNISPLTLGSDILKVKSVARVTSGVSRFFELSDVSGKYGSTNIFASDGILYKNNSESNFTFTFSNQNDIWNIIKTQVEPIVSNPALLSFYYDQYRTNAPVLLDSTQGVSWNLYSNITGQSTGYFISGQNSVNVGTYASNNLQYIAQGAMIKFVAPGSLPETDPRYNPSLNYFTPSGNLVKNQGSNGQSYIWAMVVQVTGNGATVINSTGPIVLSNVVGNGAIPVEIIPAFINSFTYNFQNNLVALCQTQQNFGLTINKISRTWTVISDTNLNLKGEFNLTSQGDTSGASMDSSWMIAFFWTGTGYEVRYRLTKYIFQSRQETAFYIDPSTVNYDFVNNTVVKDQIKILSVNALNTSTSIGLGKDYPWQIDNNISETDGYIDPSKVQVSFYNYDNSGYILDPDSFNNIVQPNSVNSLTGYQDKFVFFQVQSDGQTYALVDSGMFTAYPTPNDVPTSGPLKPADGDLYYFYDPAYNVVNTYVASGIRQYGGGQGPTGYVYWQYAPGYQVYPGRSDLKFQYLHNSGEDTRIDPSKTNIIDIYLLTSEYDSDYRTWLSLGGVGTTPLAPTSNSLSQNYSALLEPIKTISDQIIFQPVSYKVLFGPLADPALQATFKAVKNSSSVASDSNLRSRILIAINDFFALQNWDFGQPFNFSELSAYVMNLLTPDITNFVIVPNAENAFGSLFQITCLNTEIFINGATVNNIEIISSITASQLNSTNNIITSAGS